MWSYGWSLLDGSFMFVLLFFGSCFMCGSVMLMIWMFFVSFGGMWINCCVFFGVEKSVIWWFCWVMCLVSLVNGSMWLKVSYGSIMMCMLLLFLVFICEVFFM